MKPFQSKTRWFFSLTICTLIFSALAAFKVLEIQSAIAYAESFPEHSESVETSTAETVEYVPTITVLGEAKATRFLELRNELAGRINQLDMAAGSTVQQGQQLLQLDISTETANLKAAQARATLARSIYQREQDLRQFNAASQEQLEQAQADLQVIEADIAALQSSIVKKTLTAPFAGVVGMHQLEVGQYLPGNTALTSLVGNSTDIWVDFQVPQFYPELNIGSTIQVAAVVTTTDTRPLSATVIAQHSVIDSDSRSRRYRALLSDTPSSIKANTALQVQVPTGSVRSLVAIPSTAVQYDQLGQFVYRLNNDSEPQSYRAQRQQVTTLSHQGDLVTLQEGLTAGDLIAAAGAFKLYEGILVRARPAADDPKTASQSLEGSW